MYWDAPERVTGAIEVPGTISTSNVDAPEGLPETSGVLRRVRMVWRGGLDVLPLARADGARSGSRGRTSAGCRGRRATVRRQPDGASGEPVKVGLKVRPRIGGSLLEPLRRVDRCSHRPRDGEFGRGRCHARRLRSRDSGYERPFFRCGEDEAPTLGDCEEDRGHRTPAPAFDRRRARCRHRAQRESRPCPGLSSVDQLWGGRRRTGTPRRSLVDRNGEHDLSRQVRQGRAHQRDPCPTSGAAGDRFRGAPEPELEADPGRSGRILGRRATTAAGLRVHQSIGGCRMRAQDTPRVRARSSRLEDDPWPGCRAGMGRVLQRVWPFRDSRDPLGTSVVPGQAG